MKLVRGGEIFTALSGASEPMKKGEYPYFDGTNKLIYRDNAVQG
ncbi:MAG: hypothetical protein P4L10_00150 [Acidobacteriaceae bacterium]|nr:hypothetical protein [Acidobacteriaceae bacterium]